MADRFQKLYSTAPNLYTEGCPVLIEAGALQKDTESGAVLAQLKMQNIGEKPIASCKVSVIAYENNGNKVEGVEGFSYLDLNADPGTEFGSKTPVFLPDNTTRKFDAVVTEIVFSDGDVKYLEDSNWKSVPERKAITTVLDSTELVTQFSSEIGCKAEYIPQVKEGLFMCSCGGINMDNVPKCCRCGNSLDSLNKLMSQDYLESRISERKKQEANAAAKKTEKKKALRKKAIIGAVALVVILIGYCTFNMIQGMNSILPGKLSWGDTYKQAERKLGRNVEKHPKLRTLGKDIKHLGYNASAGFHFQEHVGLDSLYEVFVNFDESMNSMEKVLTKKYGEPQSRSDDGDDNIEWVYQDTEIILFSMGSSSCVVWYRIAD